MMILKTLGSGEKERRGILKDQFAIASNFAHFVGQP